MCNPASDRLSAKTGRKDFVFYSRSNKSLNELKMYDKTSLIKIITQQFIPFKSFTENISDSFVPLNSNPCLTIPNCPLPSFFSKIVRFSLRISQSSTTWM